MKYLNPNTGEYEDILVLKGDKGFSPSARVERTSAGAIITITDESGTTEAEVLDGHGGGGEGGTTDYNALDNKPAINGHTLRGDISSEDLGIKDGEKGEKGDKGDKGDQGIQGVQGAKGDDGYTPQKGVDYWTEGDKEEIKADLEAEGYVKDVDIENMVEITDDEGIPAAIPRDADRLAGQLPSYYAKQSDVDDINSDLTNYMKVGRDIAMSAVTLNPNGNEYAYISAYKSDINWVPFAVIDISDHFTNRVKSIARQNQVWVAFLDSASSTSSEALVLWVHR